MLTPKASLTVGDRRYEEQITAVRLRKTMAPGLDRLEIAMPLATTFDAGPGDDCALVLDGGDPAGGGGSAEVFTGRITQVSRRGDALCVTAHNGGFTLAQYRPIGAFQQLGLDEVIARYCGDAGIDTRIDIDAPVLALYAANGHATALQEVARLAEMAGSAASFAGDGTLHINENGGPDAELALKYGRELLGIDIAEGTQPADTIVVVGEGAGAPTTPEARWLSTDFLSGSAPAAGIASRRRSVPELRDSDDTEAASKALAARRSRAARPIFLRTWLMPTLAPGMRLELADLPEPLSLDECWIAQVDATLTQGGTAETRLRAFGAAAAGGGLLSAVAGLL